MNSDSKRLTLTESISYTLRWLLRSIPVAAVTGTLVAAFLWSLDKVTDIRLHYAWLLYLLPFAGIAIHLLYKAWGKESESGNNLIIDEIHRPDKGVPPRMAPLILVSTVVTHLFGGSAGREGTAVQVGGSMAQWIGNRLKVPAEEMHMILICGIAAGFGAVFGTPFAGAVFTVEVLAIGTTSYRKILPPLFAAILADYVCSAWGIHHTLYSIRNVIGGQNLYLCAMALLMGAASGLCGMVFARIAHHVKHLSHRFIPGPAWFIPFCGGIIIVLLSVLLHTSDYLGLGVYPQHPGGVSVVSAFKEGGADGFSWWWKMLFTAITLGTGFKGGEVTPLFFIGATLGNTIATLAGAPVDLFAGLGFIAVFAGATNTPVACTIMGIELFGTEYALYYALACFAAYYCSGHKGIYTAQRIHRHKYGKRMA
ncbi:MAG: voltage-gated chloride channel family protein [Chitinophagaceae bacterium]